MIMNNVEKVAKKIADKTYPIPKGEPDNLGKATEVAIMGSANFCFQQGFLAGVDWEKERTVEKAVKWLEAHINISKEVSVNEAGEPLAESYLSYLQEKAKVTNKIISDFKKAMED